MCLRGCCQGRSSGAALALGDLFVALAGFISTSAAEPTASVAKPSPAVVHAVRLAVAAAAALPRCWATLREPDRARLAHAAGLMLAPGQRFGMTAEAGVLQPAFTQSTCAVTSLLQHFGMALLFSGPWLGFLCEVQTGMVKCLMPTAYPSPWPSMHRCLQY